MQIIKKILNIMQIPIKIALLALITFYSFSYLNKVFVTKDVDYGTSFHSLPNNVMDVIVLGSSHAQYSFNPPFFFEDTGLYSYVLGSPCQPLEVSVEMLKEALKTQKPKLAVLEAYTALPLSDGCKGDVCYVSAEYQMTGDEKYNTIDYLGDKKAKTYYNEFLNNHNNWIDIKSINDLKINENYILNEDKISPNFGYVEMYRNWNMYNSWYAISFDDVEEGRLRELDLKKLKEIRDICKENNIELLMYHTPIDSMDENNQAYLNAIIKWTKENNINFINFFDLDEELNYQILMHSDSSHANMAGAGIITNYLAEYIRDNYDFNHKNNDMLNKKYLDAASWMDRAYLNLEDNRLECIKRMVNDNNILLVKYDGNYLLNDYVLKMLNQAGITSIENGLAYYGIIKDGRELIVNDNEINYLLNDKEVIINQTGIKLSEENILVNTRFSIVCANSDLSLYSIKEFIE